MTQLTQNGELQLTKIAPITPYPGYEHQINLAPHTSSTISSRPSSTSSSQSGRRWEEADKAQRKRLSKVDQGCFLTGVSDVCLELAHIIKPVRNKNAIDRKYKVELYIKTWLAIADNNFHLEHMSNIVFLMPDMHRHIDVYSTIAITCAEPELVRLIEIFRAANKRWQDDVFTASTDGLYPEAIGRETILIREHNTLYDIVILKASHLLPFHRPLCIRNAPDVPLQADQPVPLVDSYTFWHVQDAELRLYPGNGDPRPPFVHVSSRGPAAVVNPLLWVLNATWKFRQFRRRYPDWAEHVAPRGQRLMGLTEELAQEIYFRPRVREDSQMRLDPSTTLRLGEPLVQKKGSQEEQAMGSDSETELEGRSTDRFTDADSLSDPDDLDHSSHNDLLSEEESDQLYSRLTDMREPASQDDIIDLAGLFLFGHASDRMPEVPGFCT
ncbi:hypothetical protein FKP32DRAFT_1189139 [Trametes sanguinea]|nr:hypothetical protein FKP32DRAFT_1189139 [Trametes sanguinea]